MLSPRAAAVRSEPVSSGCSSSGGTPPPKSIESQRPVEPRRAGPSPCLRAGLLRERVFCTAVVLTVLIGLGSLMILLREGTSNLHLRAATLRAAGGSAIIGARGMCCLRTAEATIVWLVIFALRRLQPRRRHSAMPATTQIMPCGGGIACRTGTCAMVGGVSNATPSAATVGAAGGGGGGGGSGLGAALNALPVEIFPSYAPDCPSPAELKEQLRRAHGSGLLCTLSGWVFALLGCFATVGAMCSLLAAAGGHTAPGVLGEMLSPHGLLGRRSFLGRSLPMFAWIAFEVSAAVISARSLLSFIRVQDAVWRAWRARAPRALRLGGVGLCVPARSRWDAFRPRASDPMRAPRAAARPPCVIGARASRARSPLSSAHAWPVDHRLTERPTQLPRRLTRCSVPHRWAPRAFSMWLDSAPWRSYAACCPPTPVAAAGH